MSNFLSPDQVRRLNEKHGYFQYADAQGDVSREFANDAIARYEQIRTAAPQMLEALVSTLRLLRQQEDALQALSEEHPEKVMAICALIGEADHQIRAAVSAALE